MKNYEHFLDGYLACALWSSTGNDDQPLDRNHSLINIAGDAQQTLEAFAKVFWFRNSCYLDVLDQDGGISSQYTTYELAGHDLWLTQNGHGTGFWAKDHWGPYQDMFDRQAKALGELTLYVGDDGLIYV